MVGKKTVLGVSEQGEWRCGTGAKRLDWSMMGALCQGCAVSADFWPQNPPQLPRPHDCLSVMSSCHSKCLVLSRS